MAGSTISVFGKPDDFAAALRGGGDLEFLVTDRGGFQARLTSIELRRLRLSSAEETLSRIAFISLPLGTVRIAWSTSHDTPFVYAGIRARNGEILSQHSDERVHERLDGPCDWGDVQISAKVLVGYGRALIGAQFKIPFGTRRWRPAANAFKRLTRLHAAAIRRVELRPGARIEAEAARGMEQELIHALINCLEGEAVAGDDRLDRERADIMARFEDTIRANPNRILFLAEICAAVAAPAQKLRACCLAHLGMGPFHYLRLRRLQLVHHVLSDAGQNEPNVAEIARRHGFIDVRRFATAYRAVFGELPSVTLRSR